MQSQMFVDCLEIRLTTGEVSRFGHVYQIRSKRQHDRRFAESAMNICDGRIVVIKGLPVSDTRSVCCDREHVVFFPQLAGDNRHQCRVPALTVDDHEFTDSGPANAPTNLNPAFDRA